MHTYTHTGRHTYITEGGKRVQASHPSEGWGVVGRGELIYITETNNTQPYHNCYNKQSLHNNRYGNTHIGTGSNRRRFRAEANIYIQALIHTRMLTYTHMHTYIHIHTHIHYTQDKKYIHTGIHTCMYTHTYMHAYIHTHLHTYIHTCLYDCICLHAYMHTLMACITY